MEKYDWGRRYEDIFAPIGRLIEQYTPEYSAEFVDGLMKKGGWCHDANDTDCRKFAFNPHRGIRVLSLRMGVI